MKNSLTIISLFSFILAISTPYHSQASELKQQGDKEATIILSSDNIKAEHKDDFTLVKDAPTNGILYANISIDKKKQILIEAKLKGGSARNA